MGWFLLRRLLRLASVVFAVLTATFFLLALLPGDPTLALLGPASGDAEARAELQRQLALDEPLLQRYFHWLGNVFQGDLGHSYFTQQAVTEAIFERAPLTVQVTGSALLLALVVSVPLAVASARRADGWFDRVTSAGTFALLGLPVFVLGVLLIFVFSVRWQVFPASGQTTWFEIAGAPVATPRSIVLPVVALAAGQVAVFTRVLRSDLIVTLRSDYILVAQAKGLGSRAVVWRHALRPSSFTLFTLAGLSLGSLIGGSVIIEQMYALPGVGRLLVTSILKRDYLLVQGMVAIISITFVLASFMVEVGYGLLDPRIRRRNG